MKLPTDLLKSLEGIKSFNKEAFEKVHSSGEQITSIRINPLKGSIGSPTHHSPLTTHIPWTEYGYYLKERPSFTFDPLFHAGCYYVQEASSMFLEQALKQTVDLSQPLKVLDLCGAPGGKSTHIQSLISKESLLVTNEVIRSRANVLKDNIIKWGCNNVIVTNNDPKDFTKLKNYFDVIVVDAPCSGSGLFRRDEEAMNEWSLNNVALCSQRQQRILADVWPALKKDGILIYSTCSYSLEEDEKIMDWMMEQFAVDSLQLAVPSKWGIVSVKGNFETFGYRFWPDKVKGEGFFLACFRKMDGEEILSFKTKHKKETVSKKEMEVIEKWIKKEKKQFIKNDATIYAWPEKLAADFNFLLNQLRVLYSGTIAGELVRDKLIPDHALAMSALVSDSVPRIELDHEQAILYLQKKNILLKQGNIGWHLMTYQGQTLGWVNILPGRINNYYPKELRILKES